MTKRKITDKMRLDFFDRTVEHAGWLATTRKLMHGPNETEDWLLPRQAIDAAIVASRGKR